MSEFSENLLFYRKKNKLTQEMLAEKLEVSRQTVSKWEAETTYPEMDKILQLCNLFSCDMDTLLRGKASDVDGKINKKYDKEMISFKNSITTATFIVITGVASLIFLIGAEVKEAYAVSIFLVFLIVSVLIYITSGIQFSNFKKKNPKILPFYTEEEIDRVENKFAKQIATGVGLILVGAIILILNEKQPENILTMITAGFMEMIAISILFFIPAGMNKMRINIDEYNKEYSDDPIVKEKERKNSTWSGAIFIVATMVFLVSGLVFQMWKTNWIVFVVAGLLSGLVSVITEGTSKKRENN